MRSIATPNDHIDMMTRMKATPLATQVIVPHISIRFSPPSPIALSSEEIRKMRSPDTGFLLQRELDRDRHDDRHRHAVEQGRRELPLFDGVEGRPVEQRDGTKHPGGLHL